ncbi:MAG: hybrid sensor histidine kinase/response regulator [Candidatus Lindowbacteria bacterium]|nr:hybrid sensor histidine kinase/response regulator [Candidatus Lindowbacteria bacterium]
MSKESTVPRQAQILIVEDDPTNIELLKAQLGNEGYVIDTVFDGEEALRRVSQTKPDLVLLDIMLPKKSGFEVCKQIKSKDETKSIPVIMVTALNDMESRVKGIAVGADDFLTRPMDRAQLLARVKSMLRIKTLHDELANETLASRESSEKLERQQRVLKSMSSQLMQASHLKYEFIVNMSHALRTPLNVIIGFSEMMQDELVGRLNDKQLKYVNNIHESGRELQRLITNIVDVFKIDTGKVQLETTEFSLRDAIGTAIEPFRSAALEKKIDITVRVAPEASRIHADPQKLAVILENLLSNAVKFSPRESAVDVKAEKMEDSIRISVADSGPGLSEDDCKRVFTEFYKVNHPNGSASGGSGLGLTICKKLVLMHGGEIWAESKKGQGSAFIFTLPQQQKRSQ